MTNITIFKDKDVLLGFEISGHADSAKYGEDIVCASISVLGITCLNALEVICGLSEDDVSLKMDDGYIYTYIENHNSIEVQTILKTFKIGIESIVEEYPQYVKLKMEE